MADANAGDRGYLVETGWLAAHIGDPDLRVVDCSVRLRLQPEPGRRWESGRDSYDLGHIPNAVFADILGDFGDPESSFDFMLPPASTFAEAIGALGIGNDTRVVLYGDGTPWWTTRMWWMMRAFGHDRVAVLNGGLQKWRVEGRPVSTAAVRADPAVFEPRFRPELVADKARVRRAIDDPSARVINALSADLHSGEANHLGYARPGRIANSVNLFALALIDPDSGTYLPEDELKAAVEPVLAGADGEVICYCGGGIAATMDAFVLALLGHDNVAVYDGSLEEWAADPDMPMQTG
jgi:thiosulfate/3-mercaptopyruvate sulfurtransferase